MSLRRWLFSPVLHELCVLRASNRSLNRKVRRIMATLDDLVQLTKQIGPAIDALEAKITAATSGALTAAQQTQVDEAFANVRAGLADAADGVDEAAAPPVVTPPPVETPPAP